MFIAVCITFRTPSPAHSDNAIPIPSASPLPRSGWTLLEISSPMTGKFASAELSILAWSSMLPWSTIPRTVTKTSIKGNKEKNP